VIDVSRWQRQIWLFGSVVIKSFEGSIVLQNRPAYSVAMVTFIVVFATLGKVFLLFYLSSLYKNKHFNESLITDCPCSILTSACLFPAVCCQDVFHWLRKSD